MTRALPVLALALLLQLALAASATQQVRDTFRPANVGTAVLRGTIVTADDDRRPLRRAKVTLSGLQLEISRTVITEDDGTFVVDELPEGRYSVRAAKEGYITMSAGARRPTRAGTAIELEAGERQTIQIALPKAAVITGQILTPEGEPAAGIQVTAGSYRYSTSDGQRRLSISTSNSVVTDDRGVYRIFGLVPGDYVLAATPRLGLSEIHIVSAAEIRAALAELRTTTASPRPGLPVPRAAPIEVAAEPRKSVALAPVYFPGTTITARAATLSLRAGEIRSGMDLDLQYVPTGTIEGTVIAPAGAGRVQLTLSNADRSGVSETRTASVAAEGRFMFRSLPPGEYLIAARTIASSSPSLPPETGSWGVTRVFISGDDVSGVTIPLRPALTISGRIVFVGAQTPQLPPMLLPLQLGNPDNGMLFMLPRVQLEGDRFTITGVVPGRYRFVAPPQGLRTPLGTWWLDSIVARGRDLLDAPLDLNDSTDDLVVTFRNRANELTGVVHSPRGLPVSDDYVVVFPRDERLWFHQSRRVSGLRLGSTGRYSFRNLPAGDYLVALTAEIEPNEWFDPEVLRALAAGATPVTLAAEGVQTLNLTLAR